jgi:type IV secretion system protein TrbG
MRHLIYLILVLFVSGCAGLNRDHKTLDYVPAKLVDLNTKQTGDDETNLKSNLEKESSLTKIIVEKIPKENSNPKKVIRPDIIVDTANKKAKQAPESDDYINSIVRYDYAEGIIFQVFTSPKNITDIRLQENETINGSPCAGDTANWNLVHAVSGSGKTSQEHIFVKPLKAGLNTNLIITTNKRTYYLEIKSFNSTHMAGVSWNYPSNKMSEINNRKLGQNINLDHLNFEYEIVGNATYKPVTVFDDTEKTYIQFSPDIAQKEIAPLYLLSSENKAQLVNYRYSPENHYYVVDCIFEAATLKMGAKKQDVVYIYNRSLKKSDWLKWFRKK